jgi:hypothetical protein
MQLVNNVSWNSGTVYRNVVAVIITFQSLRILILVLYLLYELSLPPWQTGRWSFIVKHGNSCLMLMSYGQWGKEWWISLEKVQQGTAIALDVREHPIKRIKQDRNKINSEMCTSTFFETERLFQLMMVYGKDSKSHMIQRLLPKS